MVKDVVRRLMSVRWFLEEGLSLGDCRMGGK